MRAGLVREAREGRTGVYGRERTLEKGHYKKDSFGYSRRREGSTATIALRTIVSAEHAPS
jgi:hypothetical protein